MSQGEVKVNLLKCSALKYSAPRLMGSLFCQHESDNNNRMIQLTDVFCVLYISGLAIYDCYKRLILLSGEHCINIWKHQAIKQRNKFYL